MIEKLSSFVSAIQAAIVSDENRSWRLGASRAQRLLADADQLTELCEVCFWASMQMEEHREVRGTLAICSPHQVLSARQLGVPAPVNLPVLVSLLTASPWAPLAVHGGLDGLHIWGMLNAEPDELVRLRITGNGTLQASLSGKVLALFKQGVSFSPKASDVRALACLMANSLDKKRYLEIQGEVPQQVMRMVATMIHHRHGGTLVLVDPDDRSWQRFVQFKFTFRNGTTRDTHSIKQHSTASVPGMFGESPGMLKDSFQAHAAVDLSTNTSAATQNLCDPLFDRVGELSLIDGAVIIDMNLELYGFGATLELRQPSFRVITLDAVTGSLCEGVPCDHIGGMRHQSAACFAHDNHSADVFVVSQDGRLSLFCWSDMLRSVVVIKNLEHFIWEFLPRNNSAMFRL